MRPARRLRRQLSRRARPARRSSQPRLHLCLNESDYLGQQKDEERVRRYEAISDFLSSYSYLNPKVPEIDSIVPLPPAKLPAWDGTFQWLKAHKANVPPPLPSEERINEMAKAKGLDPESVRPLDGIRRDPATTPDPEIPNAYRT